MGTTFVACLFFDNRVSIAHVGDARLYRQRNNKLEQITLDHSLLQELVDRGFYSPEEAQRSTNRNYVQLSNDQGGKDNISIILAHVREPFPAKTGILARIKKIFR